MVYGCIKCPYHGWKYATDGVYEKVPYAHLLNVLAPSFKMVDCLIELFENMHMCKFCVEALSRLMGEHNISLLVVG